MKSALTDHIKDIPIGYSPASAYKNYEWHYGLGVWLECHDTTFNCSEIEYISSPGAFGAYPFVNLKRKYFGIISREGVLGSFLKGIEVFDSVREQVNQWGECQ